MRRSCARPACGNPPAATLAYDYAGRSVWVDPLADESHPMTHDLCARHADTLSVPNGWALHDRRVDAALLHIARAS
ncbi:MAG: DUF3499 family protein [Acidimicrobiia bacterium]|nr:DUF3499 family protein [Acidimicrobiia bacterium]